MALKLKTAPAALAVTLADAKAHLRVEHTDDDTLITSLIDSATTWAEQETQRALITRTYEFGFNGFGDCIALPKPPLIAVNAITYVDTAGDSQTLATDQYRIDGLSEFGMIEPAYGVTWPETRDQANSVIVDFDAGYGDDATDIPGPIKAAMLLLIGHLYENREETIVGAAVNDIQFGIRNLLMPYIQHRV